jgi:hypothetical protein
MTSRIFEGDNVGGAAAIAGAGLALGLGLAMLSRRRAHPPGRPDSGADGYEALGRYLRDHLSGSDTALAVVERLQREGDDPGIRSLATALQRDFVEEREVVRTLLSSIGVSGHSTKRAAARVVGGLVGPMAGGRRGELSLLRTLESLAVGVQGKRCLWRALGAAFPARSGAGPRTFVELEAMAVAQWEAIERVRQPLARATFQREGSYRRADRRQLPV